MSTMNSLLNSTDSASRVAPHIAVIGCGYWGKNLVRVFSELKALHTVCDADTARFETLKCPVLSLSL